MYTHMLIAYQVEGARTVHTVRTMAELLSLDLDITERARCTAQEALTHTNLPVILIGTPDRNDWFNEEELLALRVAGETSPYGMLHLDWPLVTESDDVFWRQVVKHCEYMYPRVCLRIVLPAPSDVL